MHPILIRREQGAPPFVSEKRGGEGGLLRHGRGAERPASNSKGEGEGMRASQRGKKEKEEKVTQFFIKLKGLKPSRRGRRSKGNATSWKGGGGLSEKKNGGEKKTGICDPKEKRPRDSCAKGKERGGDRPRREKEE